MPPFNQKALVLISGRGLFRACREILENHGCAVTDAPEDLDGAGFVVMDDFFLGAGAPEWLHGERFVIPYVWVKSARDLSGKMPHEHVCYHKLSVPFHDLLGAKHRIAAWFESAKAQFLLRRHKREFGAGLWFDLMMRLGAFPEPAMAVRRPA